MTFRRGALRSGAGRILAAIVLALVAATSARAEDRKAAIIFLDPSVTSFELAYQTPRVVAEAAYLEAKGYVVGFQVATVDTIVAAIITPNVEAMSFFGHGIDTEAASVSSSILKSDAARWRQSVRPRLQAMYSSKGYSPEESLRLADEDSRNFGFALVRNHSCASLYDTDIARQFVRPGGYYYGVKLKYIPCPSPKQLLADIDFVLDEYKVTGAAEGATVWASDFGDIRFPALEGSVTAPFPGGTIKGSIGGNHLTGIWVQEKSKEKCETERGGTFYWGNVGLTFNEDFTAFTGSWDYCSSLQVEGRWNGTRKE